DMDIDESATPLAALDTFHSREMAATASSNEVVMSERTTTTSTAANSGNTSRSATEESGNHPQQTFDDMEFLDATLPLAARHGRILLDQTLALAPVAAPAEPPLGAMDTVVVVMGDPTAAPAIPSADVPPFANAALGGTSGDPDVLYRVDDILMAIKILAYLSKYPALRSDLHTAYSRNVFELVEVFTSPSNILEVRKWATICMRNAFKRDNSPPPGAASASAAPAAALRRCGFLQCGKFEEEPRQYSKCSRCRRVTYCSKVCQRKAWGLHRQWCLKYNKGES
ncbi:MAG: hypothetical protein SGCHY_003629, partial [Lobulomycetales sp.]